MRKTVIATAILGAALLIPAGASSGKGGHKSKVNPSALCAQERKAGKDAFEAKYGDPAMPGCKQFVRGLKRSAAKECKQERRNMGRAAFASRYGSNHGKRNAFGKCVSRKVKKSMGTSCPDDEEPGDDEDAGDDEELGEDEPGDEIGEDVGDEFGVEGLRLGRAYASCDDDPGDEGEDEGDVEDDEPDEEDSDF
jgi:hypothetical protein